MAQAIYIGYSSVGAEITFNTILTDINLIKRDLYNAFYTRVGERVMRPELGCKIWDYLFNQGPNIQQLIYDEVLRIVNLDPRTTLLNANLITYQYGVRVEILLQESSTNQTFNMLVDFNTQQSQTDGNLSINSY